MQVDREFFGERIFHVRQVLHKYTYEEVEKALRIPSNTIQAWEKLREGSEASFSELDRFCRYFGINTRWVLEGCGKMALKRGPEYPEGVSVIRPQAVLPFLDGRAVKVVRRLPTYEIPKSKNRFVIEVNDTISTPFQKGENLLIATDKVPSEDAYVFVKESSGILLGQAKGGRKIGDGIEVTLDNGRTYPSQAFIGTVAMQWRP
ncbi:helix-turn-helix domain-containing protein [Neptuniibacter sp. QD37_11]|uniref:helix-turn-helix domain-containing protein n=1 Tax=Neptuniibacter sp. QD37_11 TaxID=3398209 RepID=UPI0039F5EC14